jgi:hypothetical protein
MKITKDYLNTHKTAKGGFTRKQFQILGINWQPKKGWERQVIGNELTPEEAELFEKAKNIKVENTGKKFK